MVRNPRFDISELDRLPTVARLFDRPDPGPGRNPTEGIRNRLRHARVVLPPRARILHIVDTRSESKLMSFSRNFIKSELEVVTTEYPPVLHQRKSIANVRRNIIVKMRSIDEDDAESLSIQRRKNFLGIADDELNYVFHSGSGDIS